MANDTHLAVLKQGVAAWNQWRAAHAAARPDFSSASLRSLDLAKVDLSGADLRQADLRGAILSGAVLIGADLAGANFFKSVLDGADLFGANLIGARFLNCAQLLASQNWQSAVRDPELDCGTPIPAPRPIADGGRDDHDPAGCAAISETRCPSDVPKLCVESRAQARDPRADQ